MIWQALSSVGIVVCLAIIWVALVRLRGIDDDCGWDTDGRDELDGLERIHGGER